MPTLEEMASGPQQFNTWFTSVCQQVAEARRVIEQLSLEDDPTEPFKSKYAGRSMLKNALSRAEEFAMKCDEIEENLSKVRLAQAALHYYIGQVSMEVEEPAEAEKEFSFVLDILGLEPVSPHNMNLRLTVHNILATLWSGRQQHDKAHELLDKAKELHAEYVHTGALPPHTLDEVFMEEEFTADERNTMFEKSYTNTLFYLAQIYGVKGDNKQAAAHCHITLQRQLESDEFEPLDWSLNCATLSQYYVTMGNWSSARHTLSCSSSVMSNIEVAVAGGMSDEEYDNEQVQKTRAGIARCWVKYCVNLLQDSVKNKQESDIDTDKVPVITEVKNSFEKEEQEEDKENKEEEIMEKKDEEGKGEGEEGKDETSEDNEEEKEKKKLKTFSDLVDVTDLSLLRISNIETGQYEDLVGEHIITTYDEARRAFKAGMKFAENAKQFYTLEEYCTDHVEIMQDVSILYKCLVHFDEDQTRQCKMHKRRIDILQELCSQLNIQHFLQVCRQLRFELGEALNTMVTLKYSIAADLPPAKQNWKKINNLCMSAITEFENFINLLNDPSGNFPSTLSEETVRPYIVSQVYIARLYGKFRPLDAQDKIRQLKKAQEHFQKAVDYYDSHQVTVEVKDEIEVAREMLVFLPIKMDKIMHMQTV